MPLSELHYLITMEKPSPSEAKQSCFPLFALVEFLFFDGLFRWVSSTRCFFLRFWSLLQSRLVFQKQNQSFKLSNQQSSEEEKKDEDELYREDVEMVMRSLGLFCNQGSEELQEKFSSHELSRLFEEKEPSLEEVKEAFDVFDENKDGFIDARELQRVLCLLGLKEGTSLESCKKMMKSFDENEDGRIDFHEFVKFMENRLF